MNRRMRFCCWVENPVYVELCGGCIKCGPIVKQHAAEQMKRVHRRIRRDVPRCGQVGTDRQVRIDPHQVVEYVLIHGVSRQVRVRAGWVQLGQCRRAGKHNGTTGDRCT